MAKKKKHTKQKKVTKQANEPSAVYGKSLVFFKSFEEQEEYNREKVILLNPIEILQHLRQMINIAYGMHGFDPQKLPKKHKISFKKPN